MAAIAKLRAPVDAFFEHVTVNDKDATFRENRLRLLNRIRAATLDVADFSKIEGYRRPASSARRSESLTWPPVQMSGTSGTAWPALRATFSRRREKGRVRIIPLLRARER